MNRKAWPFYMKFIPELQHFDIDRNTNLPPPSVYSDPSIARRYAQLVSRNKTPLRECHDEQTLIKDILSMHHTLLAIDDKNSRSETNFSAEEELIRTMAERREHNTTQTETSDFPVTRETPRKRNRMYRTESSEQFRPPKLHRKVKASEYWANRVKRQRAKALVNSETKQPPKQTANKDLRGRSFSQTVPWQIWNKQDERKNRAKASVTCMARGDTFYPSDLAFRFQNVESRVPPRSVFLRRHVTVPDPFAYRSPQCVYQV